jgi:hypothetical protein
VAASRADRPWAAGSRLEHRARWPTSRAGRPRRAAAGATPIGGGRRLQPPAAGAVRIPAVVARGDLDAAAHWQEISGGGLERTGASRAWAPWRSDRAVFPANTQWAEWPYVRRVRERPLGRRGPTAGHASSRARLARVTLPAPSLETTRRPHRIRWGRRFVHHRRVLRRGPRRLPGQALSRRRTANRPASPATNSATDAGSGTVPVGSGTQAVPCELSQLP